MKYLSLAVACAALIALGGCEEKKSLDGHSMEKPPPSAYMERDSAPQELKRSGEEAAEEAAN